MFHGFTGFRWPVASYGSETACAYQIYNTFWEVVSKLHQYGLIVDYVNMLSSSGNLRKENFVVSDIFQRDHKICLIQDIKHVLKKIRNSILASRLEYEPKPGRFIVKNSRPIVWNHWENAYKYNVKDGFPIHKTLQRSILW